MSVSLLELIEHGGFRPLDEVDDARWLLSKVAEFEELISEVEDFLEELDRSIYEAELAQERADELRQAKREEGQT